MAGSRNPHSLIKDKNFTHHDGAKFTSPRSTTYAFDYWHVAEDAIALIHPLTGIRFANGSSGSTDMRC